LAGGGEPHIALSGAGGERALDALLVTSDGGLAPNTCYAATTPTATRTPTRTGTPMPPRVRLPLICTDSRI